MQKARTLSFGLFVFSFELLSGGRRHGRLHHHVRRHAATVTASAATMTAPAAVPAMATPATMAAAVSVTTSAKAQDYARTPTVAVAISHHSRRNTRRREHRDDGKHDRHRSSDNAGNHDYAL